MLLPGLCLSLRLCLSPLLSCHGVIRVDGWRHRGPLGLLLLLLRLLGLNLFLTLALVSILTLLGLGC